MTTLYRSYPVIQPQVLNKLNKLGCCLKAMKKVLFVGTTFYDFTKPASISHLKEKFEGLAASVRPYILGRGKPFYKKIWGSDFYLLPNRFLYWLLVLQFGFFICLTKRIDTIVAQSPLIEGFVGALLKKFLRQDLIVEVHGDWENAPFLSKKRRLRWLQKRFIPVLAKFSLRTADKIRAISQFTKNKALKISGPKPCFVFPTFTDIDSFLQEKLVTFENFILFVGALEKVKGVDILIEAFFGLVKEFPYFKLVIIGAGSEKKNLEFRVKNLELGKRVEFQGRLSLEETENIMKHCYCLVLPSVSEGLGRVLIEAMALGKPVIGSKVGGIPDLIKHGQNGFLFEVGKAKELTERLKILLENKDLALTMGEQGRAMVREKFSNQKYIQNYLQMFNVED